MLLHQCKLAIGYLIKWTTAKNTSKNCYIFAHLYKTIPAFSKTFKRTIVPSTVNGNKFSTRFVENIQCYLFHGRPTIYCLYFLLYMHAQLAKTDSKHGVH